MKYKDKKENKTWYDYAIVDDHIEFDYAGMVEGAHLSSFEEIGSRYARDKDGVYFTGSRIPGADPKTFTIIGDGIYARDSVHVYWCGQKMGTVDPSTFRVLGIFIFSDIMNGMVCYAKDQSSYICNNAIVSHQELPAQIVGTEGAHDYEIRDPKEKLSSADHKTWRLLGKLYYWKGDTCQCVDEYAVDQKNYYMNKTRISREDLPQEVSRRFGNNNLFI